MRPSRGEDVWDLIKLIIGIPVSVFLTWPVWYLIGWASRWDAWYAGALIFFPVLIAGMIWTREHDKEVRSTAQAMVALEAQGRNERERLTREQEREANVEILKDLNNRLGEALSEQDIELASEMQRRIERELARGPQSRTSSR